MLERIERAILKEMHMSMGGNFTNRMNATPAADTTWEQKLEVTCLVSSLPSPTEEMNWMVLVLAREMNLRQDWSLACTPMEMRHT